SIFPRMRDRRLRRVPWTLVPIRIRDDEVGRARRHKVSRQAPPAATEGLFIQPGLPAFVSRMRAEIQGAASSGGLPLSGGDRADRSALSMRSAAKDGRGWMIRSRSASNARLPSSQRRSRTDRKSKDVLQGAGAHQTTLIP